VRLFFMAAILVIPLVVVPASIVGGQLWALIAFIICGITLVVIQPFLFKCPSCKNIIFKMKNGLYFNWYNGKCRYCDYKFND